MADDRPDIPEPIKREVRQRCGFGCVLCGYPFYQYEHMTDYSEVLEHNAYNITLLCADHHTKKTNKWLPVDDVRSADSNPHNKRAGVSKPFTLEYSGTSCELVVGGFKVTRTGLRSGSLLTAISIDSVQLIGFEFEDGHLLVNAQFHDRSGNVVMKISRNELTYVPTPWDISLVGTTLKIHEASRKVLVEMEFLPPNKITVYKGYFYLNGLTIEVSKTSIWVPEISVFTSGGGSDGAETGILVGVDNTKGAVGFYDYVASDDKRRYRQVE